ncbi:MAG: aminoglycoside phosphotransferase family protein [Planctomycetaceae bacterium]|nr:aminoglycoside phosphotransferase family protein [Planctomycetaceae bacterium]
MASGTPAAEVTIDDLLVRRLLHSQFPKFADLPLQRIGTGWDNDSYRVGKNGVIRLPRRELGAKLIENEQTWLPKFEPRLPLPVPSLIGVGRPTEFYPWKWSMLMFLPGTTANVAPPDQDQAPVLARFLKVLHQPDDGIAPPHHARGVPLQLRSRNVEELWARIQSRTTDVPSDLFEVWEHALEAPRGKESRWLHGDLHARNVLTLNGKISGIIDWGDITAGDVATDLASAWSLFESPFAREDFFATYQPTLEERTRAQGWAFLFAVMLLDSGLIDHPEHAEMGRNIFRRLGERADHNAI